MEWLITVAAAGLKTGRRFGCRFIEDQCASVVQYGRACARLYGKSSMVDCRDAPAREIAMMLITVRNSDPRICSGIEIDYRA
jgi:hypothetical protein